MRFYDLHRPHPQVRFPLLPSFFPFPSFPLLTPSFPRLSPRNYDTAFFEIASLRVYFNPDLAANSTAAALVGFPSTVTVASGGGGTGQTTSGAVKGREVLGWAATVVAGAVVVGVLGF